MELLGYGACYVAARCNMADLGYNAHDKPLLAATVVHLRVLAPCAYYLGVNHNRPNLLWLQEKINAGLQCVEEFVESLQMDFGFEAFPEDFDLNTEPAILRDCLCRRVPAYPPAAPRSRRLPVTTGPNQYHTGGTGVEHQGRGLDAARSSAEQRRKRLAPQPEKRERSKRGRRWDRT